MLAADHLDRAGRGDELARLTIDATDIDRVSLDRARAARYRPRGAHRDAATIWRGPYFEPAGDERRVIDRVRRRVHVRPLDLSREAPLRTNYDLILCRNVVIYFDRPMQERLFLTFAECARRRAGIWCSARSRPCSARPAIGSRWSTRASACTGGRA